MRDLLAFFSVFLLLNSSFGQVDVGTVTVIAPSSPVCPVSAQTITIRIRNYAVSTIDFAVNPVTVTADITGASTQSFSTVLNSGTLASHSVINVTVTTLGDFTTVGTHSFNI